MPSTTAVQDAFISQRLSPSVDADTAASIARRIVERARISANQGAKPLARIARAACDRVQDRFLSMAIHGKRER